MSMNKQTESYNQQNEMKQKSEDELSSGDGVSNTSFESSNLDSEEYKKKMMQGFDEMANYTEMICKRVKKDSTFIMDDDYENITDPNAYTDMLPVHKASKFGGRLQK